MKQMKQSKQYAKFTEINKRRWHNKIKETVKEWIYVQDHRRDMSYFDTLVARSTLDSLSETLAIHSIRHIALRSVIRLIKNGSIDRLIHLIPQTNNQAYI